MHDDHHHLDTTPGSENYEQRDAHLKLILVTGVALVVTALACFLTGYIIMSGFESRPALTDFVPSPIANERVLWETPVRLQTDPGAALHTLQADFASRTTRYEELDKELGVYRIPVDVAMDIVAEHGLPDIRPVPAADGAVLAAPTPAPAGEAAH